MELNRSFLFFIFGITLLPKIYSDIYPSLFIIKQTNKNYAVADEIQYVEDRKDVAKFSSSPEYQVFNACPEEDAPRRRPEALKVQGLVIDFEARPLRQFFAGNFVEYNCQNPIKPIVLKSKESFENNFTTEHDIGFLIHDNNADFGELWKKYPSLPKVPGYDFIPFLTITMDRQSGTIISVRHRIISRELLVPDLGYLGPLHDYEKNADVYGFNVNPLYEKENQQKIFSSIFTEHYSHYYDYQEDRYLIKFQLAPYEDFLLSTWKVTSFMNLNTAAMWKQLHHQWRKIEIFVREVARDLDPLIIETGTAKILTLPVVGKKRSQAVYLREGEKSPVPKYIWKQVTFKQSDDDANTRAILIIMHNDPYTQNQTPICKDKSKSLGWIISNKDYKTGLTYVCPVDEKITTKLRDEYKANYTSLDLNNMKELKPLRNDIFPSLFIMKSPNTSYFVANEFEYVEGQHNILEFGTFYGYQLYYACPEKNASFYRTYTMKAQGVVKDFEARSLQQFLEGDFIKYNCQNPIRPTVLKVKRRLKLNHEFQYVVGFLIHDNDGNFNKYWEIFENFTEKQEYDFLHFLTITMDRKSGTIISVGHQIFGGRVLEPEPAYSGPFQDNKTNIDVYGFDVNSLYTEENQQKMFSSIFGKHYSRYYDHQEDRCLIKVQLAPHEDFILHTWKLPSFMDLNTTAMWKQLHSQWRKIEIFVRKVARVMEGLFVETGTAKILSLPAIKDKSQSVYLREGQKSPVPQYIWKQLKFKQSDDDEKIQAILIVMHNDPYTPDQEPICEDVSENWGWIVSNKDYKTGLTYGCPVNEKITSKLQDQYKQNYGSFKLNIEHLLEHERIETFPSLFIIKQQGFYTVADEFEYVEGQENIIKFSTSSEYQLYNICPEENAPFLPTYTLKLQESVTDLEAFWEEFVKGDFIQYNCRNPIKPTVLKSKETFDDIFVVEYDIGFLIHDNDANFDKLTEKYENFTEIQEYVFLRFLTIRMNQKTGTIIEVCHQIISRGLLEPDSAYSGSSEPSEKNVDVYGFDVNSLYIEENQASVFTSTFPERHSYYFRYPNQSLRKVQLAPHEDFQLNTWKLSSFIDLNTAAMWEQLYAQWRRIEIFVREVALELEVLNIETGAAKILTLADVNDQQQPVYLRQEQKSPVPQYFWKLIKFEQLDDSYYTQAILIVMHNDPYTPDQKPICEDVSENWGWMVSNNDYKTGLTYGCPVKEHITSKLYDEYKVNYTSLNLKYVQKVEHNEKDIFPSLFIMKKPLTSYAVADKFEYVEGQDNVLKFSTSHGYELYNACPEEKAPFHQTYALKVQELVTDFEASRFQQFVQGDFVKYNCRHPIKPTVLKSKLKFKDKFAVQYDIGFLIHDNNGSCDDLSDLYDNFTEIQEYNFLHFLAITMDRHLGTTISVLHRIISRGFLKPDSVFSGPFQSNEKNIDVYGFDINSLYTEENQQNMFSSIFGKFSSHYYNHADRFLLKVQLAPHEDFLLDIWKLPTFMDLNTVAMWRQLYPQWRRIEMFVRKVAREFEALTIETGAARILTLPDARYQKEEVYLRKKRKFPVHKYIWKLIKFDQLGNDDYTQAILIVLHNDPYSPDQTPICDDVSENWGWMVSNKDYKTGLTYGCKVVGNITRMLHDEYNVNYKNFDLKTVYKLAYYENGLVEWLTENVYLKVMSNF